MNRFLTALGSPIEVPEAITSQVLNCKYDCAVHECLNYKITITLKLLLYRMLVWLYRSWSMKWRTELKAYCQGDFNLLLLID